MVLAIWIGASVEHIHFDQWILIGLLSAAILAAALRIMRRTSLASLRGSPVLALWLAARFLMTPALLIIALAWLVSWGLGLAATPALLKALTLVAYYGSAAILATSVLADLMAAIRGPGREPPAGA